MGCCFAEWVTAPSLPHRSLIVEVWVGGWQRNLSGPRRVRPTFKDPLFEDPTPSDSHSSTAPAEARLWQHTNQVVCDVPCMSAIHLHAPLAGRCHF